MRTEEKWFVFNGKIYDANVFMFIGSRKDMFASAVYGMRGCFGDPKSLLDAELISDELNGSFGTESKGIDGECLSIETDCGKRTWFVRMDDFDGSIEDTVMLSHECLHVAKSMLDHFGVRENPPYEALCYLHESIFKSFMLNAFGMIGMLKDKSNVKGDKDDVC